MTQFLTGSFLIWVEKLLFGRASTCQGTVSECLAVFYCWHRSSWRHLKTWGQAAVLSNWTFVAKTPSVRPVQDGWRDGRAENGGSEPVFSTSVSYTRTTALRSWAGRCVSSLFVERSVLALPVFAFLLWEKKLRVLRWGGMAFQLAPFLFYFSHFNQITNILNPNGRK